ncbi:MAG: glucose-1-phosphate adenylyltransferase [Planctomycetales bacterium]|nr:glucose-1-phosphate adenylyltransferase [Planctomycetales bacterium]
MKNTIALVLGGGRGTRLFPLTAYRSKPAVPLAARYRLIDIPLSNCINSDLNRIYVLTQFMSVSLHRHIRQTYRFDHFGGGFVELLAAQQTMDAGTDWYEGTADAVRKNLRYVRQRNTDYVLILSGDQLYRMDYRKMLQTHIESGADATIGAMPVSREAARSLGVMRANESGRIEGFLEKPSTDQELDSVHVPPEWFTQRGVSPEGRGCLASMGIYIFNQSTLIDVLEKTQYRDFGKEIFPASIRARKVVAHLFDDYWEDIGTIRAFYEANLSLAQSTPPFEFVSSQAPVFTRPRFLPPTRIDGAHVEGSMIAEGCRIGRGAVIRNSIVGLRCIIGEGVHIEDSVLMGADYYGDDGDPAHGPRIGNHAKIVGSILDKNCVIGQGAELINPGIEDSDPHHPLCVIRDGIPVVIKQAEVPDGWRLADHMVSTNTPIE